MRKDTRLFTPNQLNEVALSLETAEAALQDFYRISPREWFPYSYDVRTAKDHPTPLPKRVTRILAEVARSIPLSPTQPFSAPEEHFSILLYDPHILQHLERRPELPLGALLRCLLTHELVHIVRFIHEADYNAAPFAAAREERRVRELTARILAGAGDEEAEMIARNYLRGEYSR